ncbi:hypothetical protein BJF92_14990 [Rhizobium rhizosphaerae]|uniref:Uncharacterized protein n=1 Tax=Xaviernesmea rhizosphaerae TaxID=1672749 RepID=A0A1Q9ACU7_9HYPH|nr:hypothetical protein [Xaviernesmea rhizosphaerae]OLP52706.1 hypothetical protein BJF92_14990 [Xaviernesmea rhizosphaerae]OQP85424.1 hypothetical protein BTR14_16160 [Xaviernesmea rhizosphaerae]
MSRNRHAPQLLPAEVAACVDRLVDEAARLHLAEDTDAPVAIAVPDVRVDGMPAGDYEIVIRRKPSALAERLEGLNNPWMRGFEGG